MKSASHKILVATLASLPGVFAGFIFLACQGTAGSEPDNKKPAEKPVVEVVLGQEFKIARGQELAIKGQDLKVKFSAMLNDSRCPRGANCIWSGDAIIRVDAKMPNAKDLPIELHTAEDRDQAEAFQQYIIKLVALDPYPQANEKNRVIMSRPC